MAMRIDHVLTYGYVVLLRLMKLALRGKGKS
jgi:hypothetical protein